MKTIKIHLFKFIPSIILILLSYISFGQNQLDGLWKSIYVTSYSDTTSGLKYTRILLDIDGTNVTLKNFDGIFKEKEIFTNTGSIDQEKKQLIFNQNTDREKVYPITVDNDYIKFNMGVTPQEEITLKKLVSYNLADKKAMLNDQLIHNFISGYFSYYNDSLGIEFYTDSTMIVTSSIKSSLSILNKWALVDFGNELFLYLSDYGPMAHISEVIENQFNISDEYDTIYTGSFQISKDVIKFNKELLIGIWEQEKPDTTGLSAVPQVMYNRDFYVNEVWEFNSEKATKHYRFFVYESWWETSRNGEILLLTSMDDRKFRILSLDENKLVVNRMNIHGQVYTDTFLRKKSLPNPTTLGKYLK